MFNRNLTRLFIDISMSILYVFLVFGIDFSLLLHEILGLGFFVLFIIHLVINYKMFKGVCKSSLKGNKKNIFLIFLDFILTVSFLVIIVTSILISREIFYIKVNNYEFLSEMHNLFSYIGLWTIGVHILSHFKFLKGVFIYLKNNLNQNKIIKSIISLSLCNLFFALTISTSFFILKKQNENILSEQKNSSNSIHQNSSNNKDDNENNNNSQFNNQEQPTKIRIEEYLGKLICNGCSRRCSLLYPQCKIGLMQAKTATQKYELEYGTSN